jgi:hypothetical protein
MNSQNLEKPTNKMPSWLEGWDEATVAAAYEESLQVQALQSQRSDAIDLKIVVVFTVTSVILTLIPAIGRLEAEGVVLAFWVLAGVAWVFAAGACLFGFQPRALEIGPNPKTLLDARWLGLTVNEFRLCRMSEMGDSHDFNRDALDTKARWLTVAVWATAVEVLALLLASLFA